MVLQDFPSKQLIQCANNGHWQDRQAKLALLERDPKDYGSEFVGEVHHRL